MSRDSFGRTLLVAGGVALFCSLLVSAAVTYLRPVQLAWAQLERNRLVLELAGRIEAGADLPDREIATRFTRLDAALVELSTGLLDRDGEALAYDLRESHAIAAGGVDIPAEFDLAQLGRRAPLAPVFLSYADGALDAVILPLWGKGMWGPIVAYIALEGDCRTVSGFAVHEHGETPGIGDRIEQLAWRRSWEGLEATDMAGKVLLTPAGASPAAGAQAFDAISGATVTVSAVSRITRYWLGPHGFGPFLERCRAGEFARP